MRESGNAGRQLLRRIMAFGVLISVATLPTTIATRAQEGGPSWTNTGSLNTAGSSGPATLLPNGKVLIVAASAELYDPSTGTWSFTGSLNVPRGDFTATLLGNGKVLVAGGYAGDGSQQSDLSKTAELYDPTTGEWSFTGSLKFRRNGHTATLQSNGKVLFAGGSLVGTFSATNPAEQYDPATGKWTLTGNLNGPRMGHAATLLQNGKVLVVGGCQDPDCFIVLGSAELYDPTTETWAVIGGPATPRYILNLTTLPNGNVLTAGGSGNYFPFWLNTAELYNPTTGLWSATGNLPNRRGDELPRVCSQLVRAGTGPVAVAVAPEAASYFHHNQAN